MELIGSVDVAAPRAALWTALNDPDVLARCIDGVETLVRTDGDPPGFEGTMHAKVGPVRARFAGAVRLENVAEGTSWRLVGEGKGGVAGFAKGSADIALADLGAAGTRLDYVVKAQVGGKLAQLGARLIEGTAKAYAENFFARLKSEVESAGATNPDAAEPMPAALSPATAPAAPVPRGGLAPLLWGSGLIAATLGFLWWQWN